MICAALQTARLHLRPVAVQDESPVLAALNDLGVTDWISVVPYPQHGGPVTSGCFEGDARSAHVLHKLGFMETGRCLNACRALNQLRLHVDLILKL